MACKGQIPELFPCFERCKEQTYVKGLREERFKLPPELLRSPGDCLWTICGAYCCLVALLVIHGDFLLHTRQFLPFKGPCWPFQLQDFQQTAGQLSNSWLPLSCSA